MKNKLQGQTTGLKADQIRRLNNLFRRQIPPRFVVTGEVAREMTLLSQEIRRQIGLLVNRQGKVVDVLVGDDKKIVIPVLTQYRLAADRLRGLKCLHTHLDRTRLTRDDLTDLALLRLDFMAAVIPADNSAGYRVAAAHIMPDPAAEQPYNILDPLLPGQLEIGCDALITAIEDELRQHSALRKTGAQAAERAILISVTTQPKTQARESLAELAALATSNHITVAETIIQQRKKVDPRFVMGQGKLADLIILALQKGVTMLIFDQELNPAQIRSLADQVEIKVIDRSQLILDIFAQRARSREGKLQVEHAQLQYLLPRLTTQNQALSRLAGGIGGRGPGETKLEIDRRRIREKINRLEKSLTAIKKQRRQQKSRRDKKGVPVISLIGYTNAGKSTLLNTLTQSTVDAENRLFMTLDPSSRRLQIPHDQEVIITDTVGFIRDLPRELMVAFRATLEELHSADLFVHVVDISNDRHPAQIQSVQRIINDLDLSRTPTILALNKQDRLPSGQVDKLAKSLAGLPICATRPETLPGLLAEIQKNIPPPGHGP